MSVYLDRILRHRATILFGPGKRFGRSSDIASRTSDHVDDSQIGSRRQRPERSGAVKFYRDSLSKNIHTRYGSQITYNPAVYTPSSSLEGVREADERRLVHVHVGDELGLELRLG